MSNPDLSLPEFKVPGISGYTPPFGTKKPDGESLTTEEVVKNLELMSLGDIKTIQVTSNNQSFNIPYLVSDVILNVPSSHSGNVITLTVGKARVGARILLQLNKTRNFQLNVTLKSPSVNKTFLFQDYSCWMVTFLGTELVVQNTDIEQSNKTLMQNIRVTQANLRDVINSSQSAQGSLQSSINQVSTTVNQTKKDLQSSINHLSAAGCQTGRNLANVFSTSSFNSLITTIHNNIVGDAGFRNLMIGDYFDIPSLVVNGETISGANQNLRIVVSGFNLFYNTLYNNYKLHVLWTFRNTVIKRIMHPNSASIREYLETDLCNFLNTHFLQGLVQASGNVRSYFCDTRRVTATGDYSSGSFTVFIPTEHEVFGQSIYGGESQHHHSCVQFPIYRDSLYHRVKLYNGSPLSWWLATPRKDSDTVFCSVSAYGDPDFDNSAKTIGVSPAFCTC